MSCSNYIGHARECTLSARAVAVNGYLDRTVVIEKKSQNGPLRHMRKKMNLQ